MNDKQLGAWAIGLMQTYAPKIAKFLGVPVPKVLVSVSHDGPDGTPASTSGTHITLNADYFSNHPGDEGAVIHELTHAFMEGSSYTKANSWMQEGLADYVRDRMGLQSNTSHMPAHGDVKGSYQQTAAFYKWVDQSGGHAAFKQFVSSMKTGDEHAFKNTYGQSIDAAKKTYNLPPAERADSSSGDSPFKAASPLSGMTGGVTRGPEGGDSIPPKATGGKGGGGSDDHTDIPPPPKDPNQGDGMSKIHEHQRDKNNVAVMRQQLMLWGIPIDDTIRGLLQDAKDHNYSSTRFYNQVRQTAAYKQAFPGIFEKDGTMKMSESQYMARAVQYQDAAQQAGIAFGPNKQEYLFRHDVSPSEFTAKAAAERQLRDNPQLFHQFSAELVARGLAKPGDLDKATLFKTIMGEGNAEWYHVWNMAVARNAAVDAGLVIGAAHGSYTALPRHLVKQVANKGLSQSAEAKGFATLADTFLTALPASKIAGYGLNKKDIMKAVFGGKNSAAIKQKIQHIMATDAAFSEGRATQQTYASAEGGFGTIGGSNERPQA